MKSRVQSFIAIFITVICIGIAPSLVIQQIPSGITERIEYYYNESLTNQHWCVNGKFVTTVTPHYPFIQLSRKRLIYTNPSTDDQNLLIYLTTHNTCEDLWNLNFVTIYSTLMLEGFKSAQIVVTKVIEAISCLELCPLLNGTIMRVNNNSQTVSFRCDPGFHINGSDILTCLRDEKGIGYWNGSTPTCIPALCSKRNLINGSEEYITWNEELGAPVGTVVTYRCDFGFTLVGNSSQTCQPGPNNYGNWSGAPPCCEPNTCEKLIKPKNGNFVTNNNVTNMHMKVPIGTKTSYKCDLGFQLSYNETRICMPDGKWSGQTVTCMQITCDHLNHLQHGSITYRLTGQSLVAGSVAMYTCDEGFEVVSGNSTRVCTLRSDGTAEWTGVPAECNNSTPPTLLSAPVIAAVSVGTGSTVAALILGVLLGTIFTNYCKRPCHTSRQVHNSNVYVHKEIADLSM